MSEADGTPESEVLSESRGPDRFMGTGAAAIVFAMVCVLAGALIGALALDSSGADAWKIRVRVMSVSAGGLYGAILIALSLLVALALLTRDTSLGSTRTAIRSAIIMAGVAVSLWLGILVILNIYVDITELEPTDVAVGTVLGDLAALVMLAVAGAWAFALAGSKRS